MKIVAMSCTQKRSWTLTDQMLSYAEAGLVDALPEVELVRIRLIDFNIRLCEGEDTCLDPAIGRCTLRDDFDSLVEASIGAKGLILSTPVYGGNVPAVLKIFQERLKSTMNWDRRPLRDSNACTLVHARSMLTETAIGALSPWYGRLRIKNVATFACTQGTLEEPLATEIPLLCYLSGRQLAHTLTPGTELRELNVPTFETSLPPRMPCGL